MICKGGHHSQKPEFKNFIRVENYFNFLAARQQNDKTYYVVHYYDDLKSHVPKTLINWFVRFIPLLPVFFLFFKRVKKFQSLFFFFCFV